jgi:hypothetical protein
MTYQKPTNIDAFVKIYGVEKAKMQKSSEPFIEIISDYLDKYTGEVDET